MASRDSGTRFVQRRGSEVEDMGTGGQRRGGELVSHVPQGDSTPRQSEAQKGIGGADWTQNPSREIGSQNLLDLNVPQK